MVGKYRLMGLTSSVLPASFLIPSPSTDSCSFQLEPHTPSPGLRQVSWRFVPAFKVQSHAGPVEGLQGCHPLHGRRVPFGGDVAGLQCEGFEGLSFHRPLSTSSQAVCRIGTHQQNARFILTFGLIELLLESHVAQCSCMLLPRLPLRLVYCDRKPCTS